MPVVLEGVVGPLVVFYLLLVLTGFRGALIAALTWSYLALGRRLLKGERVSMLLLFGTILITLRTVIAFVTGSAFLYFAQPTAGTVMIAVALLVSAVVGRPFTQRFAHDFCPMDPAIMRRPLVRRFFIRISVLWATVLMLNAGLVFWLLLSSSLRSFVLERSAVTYGLTAIAIFFSITGFMAMMRRDGITVQWANTRAPRLDSKLLTGCKRSFSDADKSASMLCRPVDSSASQVPRRAPAVGNEGVPQRRLVLLTEEAKMLFATFADVHRVAVHPVGAELLVGQRAGQDLVGRSAGERRRRPGRTVAATWG